MSLWVGLSRLEALQNIAMAFQAGYEGKLEMVKAFVKGGAHIDLGSMGASQRQDEIREKYGESKLETEHPNDPRLVKQLLAEAIKANPEDFALYKNLTQVVEWSLQNGACLLFTFVQKNVQPVNNAHISNAFFSRVSMLRGPGDVPKGSFGRLSLSDS